MNYTRTFVDLEDGGHVALDWLDPFRPGQPTVLVLHGLTGGSDETYDLGISHPVLCWTMPVRTPMVARPLPGSRALRPANMRWIGQPL